jgi:putative ABC transport system permease protein
VVIVVPVVILALIAMANLLTATGVGLRDHVHEAGILEAMGLTPRQVTPGAPPGHGTRCWPPVLPRPA